MAEDIVKIDKEKLKEKLSTNKHRLKKSNIILVTCLFSVVQFVLTIDGGNYRLFPNNWKYILLVFPGIMMILGIIDFVKNRN